MANTLVSSPLPGIASKNHPPVHPLLIRAGIFFLGMVFVMTPFLAWYSDTKPNNAVTANHALLNKEMERAYEILNTDDRFKGVRLYTFEDPVPTICLTGKVANEEDYYQLKESIGFIRLKVKVIWMVVASSPKNNEAIP